MKKRIFFRKRKEDIKIGMENLACIFIVALLTGACAGSNRMQASVHDKSKPSEIIGDQTIECRRRAPTGSRLKRKICKTKAQWAREDDIKQQTAEKLQKDSEKNQRLYVPPKSGQFPGTSPPR